MAAQRIDHASPPAPRGLRRRSVLSAAVAGLATWPALAQDSLRIPHVFGETVLRGVPRRVVSLGYTTGDALLALGVQPVAVRRWFGDQPDAIWPWARPLLAGPPPAVLVGDVSVERVALLEPDLIVGIGSGISRAEYDALSGIAPVLMQAGAASFEPWDEIVSRLGLALGLADRAAERVAATRRRFDEVRARHPDWAGRTAVAAYNFGGETGAFTGQDTRGRFLAELGFVVPAELQRLSGTRGFYAKLSPEDLSPLDADLLVWISTSGTANDIAALPMRPFLRAHREGREMLVSDVPAAALSFGSVLSLPFALDALEGEIAAAMDGDPATPVASAKRAGLAP
ncbi:ABC transporter substrate-binding protein [Roseomonas haemaphysalidis]|uniref:ABC transporter substrate-binding protein n=1 Tax=Roseomonas haemaphysalidis TaxID=2768162 RepID=UPI001F2AB8B5|nr:ABC transporter substrate-binding protein [Roseomonas haemaphysalidis]